MELIKKEDCFYLGRISKLFGYKGELTVFLDVDEPQEYSELDGVYVEVNKMLVLYEIENIRVQGNKAVVRFKDVNEDDANRLVGKQLFLPLEMLPELEGNKFYFHEVIGFEVEDEKKGRIGRIAGVYENAPQPLLSVEFEGKEILIPAVDGIIQEVLRDQRLMKIKAPEGLIDLYIE